MSLSQVLGEFQKDVNLKVCTLVFVLRAC